MIDYALLTTTVNLLAVLGAIVADAIERKEGPYSRQFQWREPLAAAERRDSCRPVVLNQTQQELLLRASL